MSERMALDTRKREQFQRLKEQFVKDQEVGGLRVLGRGACRAGAAVEAACGVLRSDAEPPGSRSWMMTSATPGNSATGRRGCRPWRSSWRGRQGRVAAGVALG